jgi:hypothetical protein
LLGYFNDDVIVHLLNSSEFYGDFEDVRARALSSLNTRLDRKNAVGLSFVNLEDARFDLYEEAIARDEA